MQNEHSIDLGAKDRALIESAITRIWATLLDTPTVEPEDNFLLLGGESLLAVQAASAIKEQLGCDVPIRSIFTRTVSEIAAEIQASTVAV